MVLDVLLSWWLLLVGGVGCGPWGLMVGTAGWLLPCCCPLPVAWTCRFWLEEVAISSPGLQFCGVFPGVESRRVFWNTSVITAVVAVLSVSASGDLVCVSVSSGVCSAWSSVPVVETVSPGFLVGFCFHVLLPASSSESVVYI